MVRKVNVTFSTSKGEDEAIIKEEVSGKVEVLVCLLEEEVIAVLNVQR